jgi:hypothetical protein
LAAGDGLEALGAGLEAGGGAFLETGAGAGFLEEDLVAGLGEGWFFVVDFFWAGFVGLPTDFFLEAGAGFLGFLAMINVG